MNGKSYIELENKYKNTFKGYSVRTVTFKLVDSTVELDTQLKFKYQLFQRYNSGLTALNQQEIRNCTYHKNEFSILFKKIARTSIFLSLCPFFEKDERMGGDEFVTLLYFLTLFDSSINMYSKDSKNPFIKFCYEKIEKKDQIYNLELFTENSDRLELSDEDEEEHEDNQIEEEKIRKTFLTKTEKVIVENLEKVFKIYGNNLEGKRQERYLIEVLYYYFFIDRRINKAFVKENGEAFGNYIYSEIELRKSLSLPVGQDFRLDDCFRDKVAHTDRVKYKFLEIKKIIESYFKLRK